MPAPTEHKTVQARILACAQEIGWTHVSREEAERRAREEAERSAREEVERAAREEAARLIREAEEKARQATRNYAKRQMTWFRNQTRDWERVSG